MARKYIAVCLAAKHDTNGNPRRVWVRLNTDGEIVEAADEGYRGYPWCDRKDTAQGQRFESTPQEYRDILDRREWYAATPVAP